MSAPTWEDVLGDRCVGVKADGDRCGHRRTGVAPTRIEFYVCPRHVGQEPISARSFRKAMYEVAELAAAISESNRRLQAAQVAESVYFMSDGQWMKIGTSKSPAKRLAALKAPESVGDKTKCPPDLDRSRLALLGTIPGSRAVESELHHAMRQWRRVGEWFLDCTELRTRLNLHGIELQHT